jgi:hypothetical protein
MMDKKINQSAMTDLEKITKILDNYLSQKNNKDTEVKTKRCFEIANVTLPKNLLQNFY